MSKSTQEKPKIDRPDSPRLYLLFAGRHGHPAHGVGSLVAAYASPEEARAAFRQARLRLSDREGWAELTVVADGTRVKRVSWFGAIPGRIDPHPAWLSAPDGGGGTARGGAPRHPAIVAHAVVVPTTPRRQPRYAGWAIRRRWASFFWARRGRPGLRRGHEWVRL